MCVPRIDEFGNIDWASWECVLQSWECIFGMGWDGNLDIGDFLL